MRRLGREGGIILLQFLGWLAWRLVPAEVAVSTEHTITAVGEVRDWSGNYGPMKSYAIKLDTHGDREVELAQKPATDEPRVGQVLHGVVEDGKFGPKFKKVQAQSSTGGFGGGGFKPRQDDPTQRRSIERQVSCKLAVELVIAGKAELKDIRVLTDRLHSAIEGASE